MLHRPITNMAAKEFRGSAMGLYSLMLSCGIAVELVLAGAADDLGGVQALFLLSGHSFLDLP